MDAQQFLTEFAHIANAPGGVARLRDMIRQFAVQGRLVPQVESEEPAESFLRRLSEDPRQVKRSRSALTTPASIRLPTGWVETSLDTLANPQAGFAFKSTLFNQSKHGMPLVRVRDVGISSPVTYFSGEYRDEFVVSTGDWLIAMDGDFRVASWEGPAALLNQRVSRLQFFSDEICKKFVCMAVQFELRKLQGIKNYTTVDHLSGKQIAAARLALPPPQEQLRIVAKVDELMVWCEKLEVQQQNRRKLQNGLRQSTLQAVEVATSPHDLQTAWARLAENFGSLFSAPEDVAEIRQIAMGLAVRGLLTDQRGEDEPACKLLERIALEQREMVLDGAMKRPKPLPEIASGHIPFDLPKGWAWARFPEIGLFGRGRSKHRPRNDPKLFSPGVYPLVQTGEVARANGAITEYHSKYSELGLAQSKLWPKGTLCITIAANIADAAILGFDACFPDSVVGFIPGSEIRDDVEYFLFFMRTARKRLLAFAPSTAQKNINLEILQSVLIPVPPKAEIARILARIREINELCDRLVDVRRRTRNTGELLASAAVSSITGIATTQEEDEPVKAPQTELIANVRLGQTPNIKAQAPLATLLVRHNGEMSAKDLWQRFGGEIDAFYSQLKAEVAHGWIQEPAVAEVREKLIETASA